MPKSCASVSSIVVFESCHWPRSTAAPRPSSTTIATPVTGARQSAQSNARDWRGALGLIAAASPPGSSTAARSGGDHGARHRREGLKKTAARTIARPISTHFALPVPM